MSYTVGLDFGTHQTKVCIEDASNPASKIYKFFEFNVLKNKKSVLLPSIVQINKDDTLSYGFVDEKKCKIILPSYKPEPVLEIIEKPVLELPSSPQKTYPSKPKRLNIKGASLKEQFINIKQYEESCKRWKLQCKQIDEDYNKEIEEWELDCWAIRNDYNYDIDEYNNEIIKKEQEFKLAYEKWEKEKTPIKQIFRYFKLAAFSKHHWPYEINPQFITIWYLTYVLFQIQNEIGDSFYTQMGVSYSFDTSDAKMQIDNAFKILISVNKLIEEYKSLDKFLKAKYSELMELTIIDEYNSDDISYYGLNVLPEAFAGLSSITQQKRIERGMHLLTDIGGGTTDIAFFTITENRLPDIHAVMSFPIGLNYIFEEYKKKNKNYLISEIQQKFRKSQYGFENYIKKYHSQLEKKTIEMIKNIEQEFNKRKHGWNPKRLYNALEDRPVLYCGGGSIYDSMRIGLHSFSDIKLINKDLLNILNIKNRNLDNSLYTILATSYGLSIQLESDINMTPIEKVFEHLPKKESDNEKDWHDEYGLADT